MISIINVIGWSTLITLFIIFIIKKDEDYEDDIEEEDYNDNIIRSNN